MANLNDLPQELLVRILTYLAKQSNGYEQWVNVNRLFYNHGAPARFQRLTFRFQPKAADILTQAVLHSPFCPGQWVQTIVLDRKSAPKNWKEITEVTENEYDLTLDPLYGLMKLCPRVIFIEKQDSARFFNFIISAAYTYLYFILGRTGSSLWQLKRLPHTNYKDMLSFSKTLKELTISYGFQSYCLLAQFKQVTSLELMSVKFIFDIEKYLTYLLQLKALQAEEFNGEKYEETNKSRALDQHGVYPNIRTLKLTSFWPTSDRELQFIMQVFPALEKFEVLLETMGDCSLYRQDVLKDFVKYLSNLRRFSISNSGRESTFLEAVLRDYSHNSTSKDVSKLKVVSMPRMSPLVHLNISK